MLVAELARVQKNPCRLAPRLNSCESSYERVAAPIGLAPTPARVVISRGFRHNASTESDFRSGMFTPREYGETTKKPL